MKTQTPQVQATITKADIGDVAARYGQTNSQAFHGYGPGCLTFTTFAGGRDTASGFYVGQYLFAERPEIGTPLDAFDFNALPGIERPKKGKAK